MKELTTQLNAICDRQPYITSWYLKDPASGREAERGGKVVVPSASTRKTSIMMAALRAAHQGRLDLDQMILYEARMKQEVVSGTLLYMTPGFAIPLRDALVQMIITSDNVCTRMVMERIGLDEINQFCRDIGMTDTIHRTVVPKANMPGDHTLDEVTVTTPCDQGLLYDRILRGTHDPATAALLGCDSAACSYALEVLSWQRLRTKIPSLLPSDTRVAHKGGTGRRGRHDAGIVYRDGRPLFILAAFTDQVPREMPDGLPGYASAYQTIGLLARACWDYLGADPSSANQLPQLPRDNS